MTAAERAERTRTADELCVQAFGKAGCPDTGVALVAVGGYGRQELAPYSDLDVVLVHDAAVDLGEWAGQIWYPLWDSGVDIDHAVRTVDEVLIQAEADLRVATGMLDVRHLAGDPNLTLRLRTSVLTQWRRDARTRLREMREMTSTRARRAGELAHASVPDLKESEGGLRDAGVLKALVASWLVDVPHQDLERCRMALLDVRDALHAVAGRATDRVVPEYWDEIAAVLRLPDGNAAQRHTRGLARRITHLSRLAWRRAEAVLREPSATGPRRPRLETVAPGVAISFEEVVLDRNAPIGKDPLLLLRAATEAAERDLVLAPVTAARLAREGRPLGDPWPTGARDLFVRLLAAGPGPARRVGDARRDRRARPGAPGVGPRPAAAPRLGRAPLHRRPAPGGDLHRGLDTHPPCRPAGRPDGRRAAPRHRQGPAHRALRGRRADRAHDRASASASTRARSSSSGTSSGGTCCCPRRPPPATPTTRARSRR